MGQYGIKPKKMWYDLYCNKPRIRSQIYRRYILTIIYPAMNNPGFRHAYTDKCFYNQLFPNFKQPRTIIKCSNNIFYDGIGNIISFMQAKSILESEKQFVLKPSVYSGEGVDIIFYDKNEYQSIDFEHILKLYRTDFIVQDIVSQHEVLASKSQILSYHS